MGKRPRATRFNPQRLIALRRRTGLSLREFGAKIRRTKAMVQQMECGRAQPSTETLTRIAETFGVDVKEFFI